jgi:hypothetical protein
MNYLVFLDAQAGELEKIVSGTKRMVLKELDPSKPAGPAIGRGDRLYFLRHKDDCALRVQATVIRVLHFSNQPGEDKPHFLKEMQPRLLLTEDQYNYWSAKQAVLLVEFEAASKIPVIEISREKVKDRSDWIAFEEFSRIT